MDHFDLIISWKSKATLEHPGEENLLPVSGDGDLVGLGRAPVQQRLPWEHAIPDKLLEILAGD